MRYTPVLLSEGLTRIYALLKLMINISLMHHALVDGNERLAWAACLTFLAINSHWITAPEDNRFDFVIAVAIGAMSDLDEIAAQLRNWSHQEG